MYPPTHQQSTDNDLDFFISDGPSTYDHTDSSIPNHTDLSTGNHTNNSGSDISTYFPPSSNAPSEVSSPVASDSDLPLLPPPGPSKPVQQSGLLKIFPIVPAAEVHATWGKRKGDNHERDKEEHGKVLHQQEEWREEKLLDLHERNRLSQQKCRRMAMNQEQDAGLRDEHGKKIQVS